MSERDHQVALADYLDALGLLWCHVPNGGRRNRVTAARMKAEGVKPGVPDVLIFTRPPGAPEASGVAVELKKPRTRTAAGRVRPEQQDWLEGLESEGWLCCVAYGWHEAARWLEARCGYGRRP